MEVEWEVVGGLVERELDIWLGLWILAYEGLGIWGCIIHGVRVSLKVTEQPTIHVSVCRTGRLVISRWHGRKTAHWHLSWSV